MTNIEQPIEQVANIATCSSTPIGWELIFAIIALCIALVAIIIMVVCYLKLKRYANSLHDNFGQKPQNVKDVIVSTVVNSTRLENYIRGIYRDCIDANANRTQPTSIKISSAAYNEIVNSAAQKAYEIMSRNTSTRVYSAPGQREVPDVSKKLYASAYNASDDSFYEVNTQTSDQTIFEIDVNSFNTNEGYLTVFSGAYAKVAECKDFLEYCCEVEGSGTSLQILEKGKVVLSTKGWKVTKKIRIRFN